ncbi:efflux transporter outer membrane subunit [Mycetohabitans sp. B8]|uniref:efflux transporter outer membrane subunit n=1 Tax=Mycetohabitans sp. B8 TaxID=2841845 RepID=UPI001F0264AF|nr:efflux transporter outer membrane subunit [Mycetohabitans sp. B8]MCG1041153.1 efflux transporter outer membrane subunit [Mycetohabitans sp. B8]
MHLDFCNFPAVQRGAAVPRRVPVLRCALAFALLLTGCAVGSNYTRPNIVVPSSFKEAAPGWKVAQPADQQDRGNWWALYRDTQLDALMGRLNAANQTVAQFAAAYRQARALTDEARASGFPTLSGSASGSRVGSGSASRGTTTSAVATGGSRISNSFSTPLDASWEADLWGGIARAVASQKAAQQAAAADLANARLSAQATLAQNYYLLRTSDAQQKVLDETVAAYQRTLELTQNRYRQGIVPRSDVIYAQTQLQSAQSAALGNGIARARYEHAIAVLVGEPASTFSLPPAPLDVTPPAIPVSVPSALLERRPDVASAERKAAAANEQIGVAMAAFFPSLTLSAQGGSSSSMLAQLLRAPSRFWLLGPELAVTIFDGGLRSAKVDAARAAYDEQVAVYRQTVLAALQDVEDNLTSLRILEQQIALQQASVDSAQQALDIVLNQYKAGTAAYLSVLTAQASLLSARQTLQSLAGQRMTASVGLIKALGGDWDVARLDTEAGSVAPLTAASEALGS